VSPPAETAPPIEHIQVQANGLRFHVAQCGTGDRLALLLHGFPECWISWRNQIPLLAKLGYRVWAPDMRGYGESERPTGMQHYQIETLLADVAGLIDASGARSTLLMAHDWGAIIAWYFAMRRPRALDRLAIMNVPHPGASAAVFRTWKQLRRSWYAVFFQIPRLPEFLLTRGEGRPLTRVFKTGTQHPENFPDEVIEGYRRSWLRPGAAAAMVNYYRALVRGGGAERQRKLGFPVIETPTLMIWGEQDVALIKETTFGTDRFVKDLTLRYLPEASHFVQQDAPEEVNAMLEAWLTGRPVPGAQS
jgi:pimeloyl-ACP methyl ester carboxylesterase